MERPLFFLRRGAAISKNIPSQQNWLEKIVQGSHVKKIERVLSAIQVLLLISKNCLAQVFGLHWKIITHNLKVRKKSSVLSQHNKCCSFWIFLRKQNNCTSRNFVDILVTEYKSHLTLKMKLRVALWTSLHFFCLMFKLREQVTVFTVFWTRRKLLLW